MPFALFYQVLVVLFAIVVGLATTWWVMRQPRSPDSLTSRSTSENDLKKD